MTLVVSLTLQYTYYVYMQHPGPDITAHCFALPCSIACMKVVRTSDSESEIPGPIYLICLNSLSLGYAHPIKFYCIYIISVYHVHMHVQIHRCM